MIIPYRHGQRTEFLWDFERSKPVTDGPSPAIWDDVFVKGYLTSEMKLQAQPGGDVAKAIACATALDAHALCMLGNRPPENFGFGMIALAAWSGLKVTDLLPDKAGQIADMALLTIVG